jgi:hypothetical protein
MMFRFLPALIGLSLVACGGGGTAPTTPPDALVTQSSLLPVASIDLLILESFPVQVTARVRGHLPDGCTSIADVVQTRTGSTVEVTITTVRSGEVCIQLVTPVTRNVRLEGAFPPGDYVLRVNGLEKPFRT